MTCDWCLAAGCRWFVLTEMKGSIPDFVAFCQQQGLDGVLAAVPPPTATAWTMIGAFAAFEATLQLVIPGKVWIGPVSPAGNRPVYWVRHPCQVGMQAASAVGASNLPAGAGPLMPHHMAQWLPGAICCNKALVWHMTYGCFSWPLRFVPRRVAAGPLSLCGAACSAMALPVTASLWQCSESSPSESQALPHPRGPQA